MEINKETVLRVATLAKLEFTEEETTSLVEDMNRMVAYFDRLNEVDTEGIEPLIFMSDRVNALREDNAFLEITKEQALLNAPGKNSDYFTVPKFLDRE